MISWCKHESLLWLVVKGFKDQHHFNETLSSCDDTLMSFRAKYVYKNYSLVLKLKSMAYCLSCELSLTIQNEKGGANEKAKGCRKLQFEITTVGPSL